MKKLIHILMFLLGVLLLVSQFNKSNIFVIMLGICCVGGGLSGLKSKTLKSKIISVSFYLINEVLIIYDTAKNTYSGFLIIIFLIPVIVSLPQLVQLVRTRFVENENEDVSEEEPVPVNESIITEEEPIIANKKPNEYFVKLNSQYKKEQEFKQKYKSIEGFALNCNEKLAQEDSKEKWEKGNPIPPKKPKVILIKKE